MNKANIDISFNGLFCTLLTILFIALKLTKVISWSWWLVLLPLYWYIPLLLILFIISIICNSLKIIKG